MKNKATLRLKTKVILSGSTLAAIVWWFALQVPMAVYGASFDIDPETVGFLLIAAAFFIGLSFMVGIFCFFFDVGSAVQVQDQEEIKSKLKSSTTEQLVDYIDEQANASVISNNNPWLAKNWHTLSENDKLKWVADRKDALINHLATANNSPTFIIAMQKADKELFRGNAAVA